MLVQVLYLYLMAIVLAVIEIQVEGKNGWASNLPTWRPKNNNLLNRLFKKMVSGKPTTGYHIAVFSFVLLIIHYPFFAGSVWSWQEEFKALSIFLLFTIVWDFLWIIINPHFGIKKMGVDHVWWHSRRVYGVPTDYYLGVAGSFLLYLPLIVYNINNLKDWLLMFAVFSFLLIITILLTPEERDRFKNE